MTVLLACEPADQGGEAVRVLLVGAGDDVLLLPAWSSYERLAAACGTEQAWVAVPLEELDALRAQVGAAAVVLDAEGLLT